MREPAAIRASLPARLDVDLFYLGYERVFWAGDGGLYAKLGSPSLNEIATRLPQIVFGVFDDWKREWRLGLRASATYDVVITHPDPGFWFSAELNDFLKYEREIGVAGEFIITEPLYRRLREHSTAEDENLDSAFERRDCDRPLWRVIRHV